GGRVAEVETAGGADGAVDDGEAGGAPVGRPKVVRGARKGDLTGISTVARLADCAFGAVIGRVVGHRAGPPRLRWQQITGRRGSADRPVHRTGGGPTGRPRRRSPWRGRGASRAASRRRPRRSADGATARD